MSRYAPDGQRQRAVRSRARRSAPGHGRIGALCLVGAVDSLTGKGVPRRNAAFKSPAPDSSTISTKILRLERLLPWRKPSGPTTRARKGPEAAAGMRVTRAELLAGSASTAQGHRCRLLGYTTVPARPCRSFPGPRPVLALPEGKERQRVGLGCSAAGRQPHLAAGLLEPGRLIHRDGLTSRPIDGLGHRRRASPVDFRGMGQTHAVASQCRLWPGEGSAHTRRGLLRSARHHRHELAACCRHFLFDGARIRRRYPRSAISRSLSLDAPVRSMGRGGCGDR